MGSSPTSGTQFGQAGLGSLGGTTAQPGVDYSALNAQAGAINNTQNAFNQQAFQQQQAGNFVGQSTPYGTLSYSQTGTGPGGMPTYTATEQLSPAEQYLLNTQQGTQAQAGTQANRLLSGVNYGAPNNIGSMTSGITGQLLGAEIGAEQPFFNQQIEAEQSQLANQGLTPTSPAYQTAMNNLLQSQYQGIDSYLAQAEPAAFQQATSLYNQPLQTATSLMGIGNPNAQLSGQFVNTPQTQINVPNVSGGYATAFGPTQLEAQLLEQQYGSALSGMAGSQGAQGALQATGGGQSQLFGCDERLKKDIQDTGHKTKSGIPIKRFKSIHDDSEHTGVLAGDVHKVHPDLVHEIGGVRFVDYGKLRHREAA